MTERKKIRKWFWAWSDQKEEVWLQQMAQEGWILERYSWYTYTFRAAAPTKLVYRLDYRMGFPDRDYFDLYEMDGWRFISTFAGWNYFCKADDGTDKLEIYSDIHSRASKYIQLSNYLLSMLILQFLCIWMPLFPAFISGGRMSILIAVPIALIILLLAYGFCKLRRKAKKLKDNLI